MPEIRRFPPPWFAEETEACFIVRSASLSTDLASGVS
jgi:hypothetical protein